MKRTVELKFFAAVMAVMMVLALGVALVPAGNAQAANCTGWSDNFTPGAQQDWVVVDGGTNSTYSFKNNRYELHTEGSADSSSYLASVVPCRGTDYVLQAEIQHINVGDNFTVFLLARGDEASKRGYVFGVARSPDDLGWGLVLGKLQVGGTFTSLGAPADATFRSGNFTLKFAVSGNSLKGKGWISSEDEPSGWQITYSDNSYNSGVGGVLLVKQQGISWTTAQVAIKQISMTPRVALTSSPPSILADGSSSSTLTATVKDENGLPDNIPVNFTTTLGTISDNTTTAGGIATSKLTSTSSTEAVVADVTAEAGGSSDTIAVFFTPSLGPVITGLTSYDLTESDIISDTDTGGSITVVTTQPVTVTTASFDGNPGGQPNFDSSGNYYDVHITSDSGVSSITIEFSPATDSTVIHYWTGTVWRAASDQSYLNGIVTVTITADTFPQLSDLEGLFFGSGTPMVEPPAPPPPAPPPLAPVNPLSLPTPSSHGASMPAGTTPQAPVILPNIQIQSASLSAQTVTPGIPVTVTADITNKSTVNGNKKVTLYVNGQVESTRGITVNSGGSSQLTFSVSRSEPGDYNVYVDGVPAGSFKVELFRESDGILVFSVALVALAFLIGIVMFWRRQRTG